MRIYGRRLIPAPPAAVWALVMTPDRLRRCLPGCERFEATGPDTFVASARIGVGFLRSTYSGTIRIVEQRYPEHLVLEVEGGGPLGTLRARGTLTLAATGAPGEAGPPTATSFVYDGEAQVGGRVAALGEPLLAATADRLIGLFFDCVAAHAAGLHDVHD